MCVCVCGGVGSVKDAYAGVVTITNSFLLLPRIPIKTFLCMRSDKVWWMSVSDMKRIPWFASTNKKRPKETFFYLLSLGLPALPLFPRSENEVCRWWDLLCFPENNLTVIPIGGIETHKWRTFRPHTSFLTSLKRYNTNNLPYLLQGSSRPIQLISYCYITKCIALQPYSNYF